MDKLPITKAGEKDLAEKLRQLKTKDRPEIAQAIAEARAHGDLKENAEYHAAREQQSFAEGRIKELEHKLSHAQIIDVTTIHQPGNSQASEHAKHVDAKKGDALPTNQTAKERLAWNKNSDEQSVDRQSCRAGHEWNRQVGQRSGTRRLDRSGCVDGGNSACHTGQHRDETLATEAEESQRLVANHGHSPIVAQAHYRANRGLSKVFLGF